MKYAQYKTLLKRQHDLNRLEGEGFKFLYKKNCFKVVCGAVCLVVAVIPNGTGLFLYPVGFMLLGFNKMDLYRFKENLLKNFKRWLK